MTTAQRVWENTDLIVATTIFQEIVLRLEGRSYALRG